MGHMVSELVVVTCVRADLTVFLVWTAQFESRSVFVVEDVADIALVW